MAKISQHLNKAIIYSLASLAENDVADVIDAFKEDMTLKQLNTLGVDRINAVLISLSGANNDPGWARETAVALSHYLGSKPIMDPADSNYRSWGFSAISAAEGNEDYHGKPAYAVAVPGSAAIMVYAEVRERVLPSVSINTELTKRVQAFEEKEDRHASPKDVAIIKEQVVASMLKTAPIRPKSIPVMFHKGLAIFFTSSAKMAEDTSALFRSILGTFPAQKIANSERMSSFFKQMILGAAHLTAVPVDELNPDDLDGYRFLPGTEGKLVDGNDGATYTIKGENLASPTGTAHPMLTDRLEVDVDEMSFTFYPQGACDVDARANAWEVKMNSKGYIKKFGPTDKSTEPVNLIERQSQHYQESESGLAAGWERGVATIWIISVFIDTLLEELAREHALLTADLGLAYTSDEQDARRFVARVKLLELRTVGYMAHFNATLEADPSLAKKRNRDLDKVNDDDDEPVESPDPDQNIYWADDWDNYGVCQTEEEFDYLVDLDEGHRRITLAEYNKAVQVVEDVQDDEI